MTHVVVTRWRSDCLVDPVLLLERIVIDPASGCWAWTGVITSWGYGQLLVKKKCHRAHRLVYEGIKGPIPKGLVLDHLCRNKKCVNPDHLEAVTVGENTRRGHGPAAENAKRTHCRRAGHPLSGENLRIKQGRHGLLRSCRQCERELNRVLQLQYYNEKKKRLASA